MGQLIALGAMLIGIAYLRRSKDFARNATVANTAIMTAGFMLMGYQLTGFFVTRL